jgi:methionyl-tRNA synthetase
LREVPRVGEADFSEERLVETANRDLANGVGNLVQRVVGLGGRFLRQTGPGSGHELSQEPAELRAHVDAAVASFDLRAATGAITAAVDRVNREIEATTPWALAGDEREGAVDALVRQTAAIVDELLPFVPDLAARAAARLRGAADETPVFARATS